MTGFRCGFCFSIDLTVSELRSKERKLTRQIEVIKKALSEIGCDELPNGWDLDNSFDQGNEIQVRRLERNIVFSDPESVMAILEP